jgi:hypothetical protein
MRYTEARAIVESAIELLAEGDNKYNNNKSYNSMENKPSTNKMEKPTKPVAKPSAQGRATNSPVVKFGKRTTSRRYVTRANRWALRQIARNKSAVSEAIEQLDEATRKKPSKSSKPKKVKKVVGERPDQTDWNAVNAYQRKLHASDGIRGLAPTPWSS